MNSNRRSARPRPQSRRVWSYKQAQSALPYLTAVMRSVREHQTEFRKHQLTADRLADKPGRPDRSTLIAGQEALRSSRKAEERLQEALDELEALDILCEAPLQGVALIPTLVDDRPAWFIFSLFDTNPLAHWRYLDDAPPTRRPVEDLSRLGAEGTWMA
jgi:hypothetical protein